MNLLQSKTNLFLHEMVQERITLNKSNEMLNSRVAADPALIPGKGDAPKLTVDDLFTYAVIETSRENVFYETINLTSRHIVVPRIKTNVIGNQKSFSSAVITPALLQSVTGLSLPQAARSFGISATAFKRACRKLGVQRWAYKRGRGKLRMLEQPGERAIHDVLRNSITGVDEGGDVKDRYMPIETVAAQPWLADDWFQSDAMLDWPKGLSAEPATEANDRLVLAMLAQTWPSGIA